MFMGPGGGLSALVWLIYLVIGIIIILTIFSLAGLWKAFTKAGVAGWKAIIPIYNLAVILKLGNNSSAWSLAILLLPFAVIVEEAASPVSLIDELAFLLTYCSFSVVVLAVRGLAEKFDKGFGFTLGLVLLPFIFWPMLGFGGVEYQDGKPDNLTPHD